MRDVFQGYAGACADEASANQDREYQLSKNCDILLESAWGCDLKAEDFIKAPRINWLIKFNGNNTVHIL